MNAHQRREQDQFARFFAHVNWADIGDAQYFTVNERAPAPAPASRLLKSVVSCVLDSRPLETGNPHRKT